jgi:hypothetical protein
MCGIGPISIALCRVDAAGCPSDRRLVACVEACGSNVRSVRDGRAPACEPTIAGGGRPARDPAKGPYRGSGGTLQGVERLNFLW